MQLLYKQIKVQFINYEVDVSLVTVHITFNNFIYYMKDVATCYHWLVDLSTSLLEGTQVTWHQIVKYLINREKNFCITYKLKSQNFM